MPNCVCFTKRLRGRSCLHKARPRPLNINCRHSFQSCPTASIPWFYVAMIMNVLTGWFFPSVYFLRWRYFCSNLVPIFSHNAVLVQSRACLYCFQSLSDQVYVSRNKASIGKKKILLVWCLYHSESLMTRSSLVISTFATLE